MIERFPEHDRNLCIKIDRPSQLRCLQNILEFEEIDTSCIEDSFDSSNPLIINIELVMYGEKDSYFKNTNFLYEVKLKPIYNYENEDRAVSMSHIKNIIERADVFNPGEVGKINDN